MEQVRGGANLLDVNMDADLLEGETGHDHVPEPDRHRARDRPRSRSWWTAREWSVIEAGLKCVQGKGVVNSISLKEGEEDFLDEGSPGQALRRRRWSSWPSTRAGQADTVERKVSRSASGPSGCSPSEAGFDPSDIIFDPEHPGHRHRHRGAQCLRQGLHRGRPARSSCAALEREGISGGVSNLSFSFRGQRSRARGDPLGVPVSRASRPGLDMAIVNAGQLVRLPGHPAGPAWSTSRTSSSTAAPDATERMVAFADTVKRRAAPSARSGPDGGARAPVEQRLSHALVHGIDDFIEDRTPRRPVRGYANDRWR